MTAIATASSKAAKRREVMLLWIKQLMSLHERQGTAKPAAAGWLASIYALRAADRLDAGAQWGRVGDEIIDDLEWAYKEALGSEADRGLDVGHRLLETHERPHLEIPTASGKKMTPAAVKAMADKAAQTAQSVKARAPGAGLRAGARVSPLGKRRFSFKPTGSRLITRRPLATAALRPSRPASAVVIPKAPAALAKGAPDKAQVRKSGKRSGKKRG